MNRRKFLFTSGAVAGSAVLSPAFANAQQNSAKNLRVVIIGAGFAGLAAAYQLHKMGAQVTILEARNRIGGRVFSFKPEGEDIFTELGAEWIGRSHLRMIALCQELGLPLHDHTYETHLLMGDEYKPKNQWAMDAGWEAKYKRILDDFKKLTDKQTRLYDRTDWWRFLKNQGIPERELELQELLDSTDFGESIRQVSAYAALAEYAFSSEKNEMDYQIVGGNSLFAERMADAIGRDKILLGHKVSKVAQPGGKVSVYCEDGKNFEADKIICTVPTYALHKISWEPAFKPDRVFALNQLQYARITKASVLYKDRFWADEKFDFLTDREAHYIFHTSQLQKGEKGLLTSYTIGEKAQLMAKKSSQAQIKTVNEALLPAFGDVSSKAEKIFTYAWGNDPYSHGAYAIYDTNEWFGLREILLQRHKNVHFAGEHLADWQGFMEGAVNTAEEAVAKL